MNLETMTVEQLKVMAFDVLVELERHQKNLQILNQAIAKKVEEGQKIVVEKESTEAQEALEYLHKGIKEAK